LVVQKQNELKQNKDYGVIMTDLNRLRELAGLPPSNQTGTVNQGVNKFNPVTPDSPENFSPFSKKDESTEVEDLLVPLTKQPDAHGQVGTEIKPENHSIDPTSGSKIFVINLNLSGDQEPHDLIQDQPKVMNEPEEVVDESNDYDNDFDDLSCWRTDAENRGYTIRKSMGCLVAIDKSGKNVGEFDPTLQKGDLKKYTVDEDMGLNNGYHDQIQHDTLGYMDRWAPRGSASTPPDSLGPSAARTSDNPEFAAMKKESVEDIHESLVYQYRAAKKELMETGLPSDREAMLADEFNAKYNYKPYSGGAGPSDKQTRHFNSILLKAVTDCGGKAIMSQNNNYSEPLHEVKVGNRMVGYDRWGYCSDDDNSQHIDQVDLYTAVKYLLGR
jgi:hypothetical protein